MRHHAGISASFRTIPFEIPTFEKLGLPADTMKRIMDNHQELVLVTGATGQEKSTTLAAMIDYVNTNRAHHILAVKTHRIHSSFETVRRQPATNGP